ncbi:hypothetical protein AWRI1631_91630 [Saccharomyces cerevisiae AWRI1631]|uniref:Uncharacterized protein n=1 Tax=Saccharomyces cerevisiae (strain AWRI1631) TaxID=545124 RepID=B5VKU8_YEAS6|nr:hypothetical protein AWRI1631_91630 [Saccharomyces cerevisiae AWRI1631]
MAIRENLDDQEMDSMEASNSSCSGFSSITVDKCKIAPPLLQLITARRPLLDPHATTPELPLVKVAGANDREIHGASNPLISACVILNNCWPVKQFHATIVLSKEQVTNSSVFSPLSVLMNSPIEQSCWCTKPDINCSKEPSCSLIW